MAELTPLDEKLAEVLGLAQAAQKTTEQVAKMEGADAFKEQLDRMLEEARETERRTDELIDSLEGRKTAIRDKAQETKSEADEMMKTYLGGEDEALDGFEFLTMAEAGELGHWEIVQKMSQTVNEGPVIELADWAVEVQRRHFEKVREASLQLAEQEVRS
jgi:rubrerythrin